jgi:predicted Zn-dependent protease
MRKLFASIAVFTALLASAVLGQSALATTADAAVNFVSWPQDVIYVYDATAGVKKDGKQVWPVKAAAERWSKDNPVDIRYTTQGCPANVQCVVIKQAKVAAPAVAITATTFVGADIRSANITLDTTFGSKNSAARRQNVVCHEMGHALGMKHRTTTASCMNSYVTSTKYPDATDIKNLNTMYGYR